MGDVSKPSAFGGSCRADGPAETPSVDSADLTSKPNAEPSSKNWLDRQREDDLRHNEDVHRWREIYLARSFFLVSFVIYISLSFVLFAAVGVFSLDKSVLIALLTSMVANVIGILSIAFYWLYGSRKDVSRNKNRWGK